MINGGEDGLVGEKSGLVGETKLVSVGGVSPLTPTRENPEVSSY